jgi:Fis family transcriptional regulator
MGSFVVPLQGSWTMRGELDALTSQMHKGGVLYTEAVREFRKAFIATVLRENNGNQSKAARELGMHRNTLTRTASALRLDIHSSMPRLAPFTSERTPRDGREDNLPLNIL